MIRFKILIYVVFLRLILYFASVLYFENVVKVTCSIKNSNNEHFRKKSTK